MEREYQRCRRESSKLVAQAQRVSSLLLDEGFSKSTAGGISGFSGATIGETEHNSCSGIHSAAISGQQTTQLPSGDDLYDHGPDIVPKQELCATPNPAIAPKPANPSSSPYSSGYKTKRKRCDTWHGESEMTEEKTSQVILDPGIEQGLNTKRKFARKNAWGYCSYADLITMALERAPSRQMTLAEIYDWIVANIPFFKDKGDHNSSIGWKNSIRHNLSLHDKFSRVTPTNTTKNIGAYWTLVPDKEDSPKEKIVYKSRDNNAMSSPSTSQSPENFRKRSSTMPTSLNRSYRPSKFTKRESGSSMGLDVRSIGGDSGIERVSPAGSCASLVNNTVEEIAGINLDNSPRNMETSDENQNAIIGNNMEKISKFNREAKINPDNSVLVEVSLTAEQFELVKSGRYIVSLCDPNAMGDNSEVLNDPRLKLNNWKAKNRVVGKNSSISSAESVMNQGLSTPPPYESVYEEPNRRQSHGGFNQPQRNRNTARSIPINRKQNNQHPFSPISSESSGIGQSYSPPENLGHRNNEFFHDKPVMPSSIDNDWGHHAVKSRREDEKMKTEVVDFVDSMTTFETNFPEFDFGDINNDFDFGT